MEVGTIDCLFEGISVSKNEGLNEGYVDGLSEGYGDRLTEGLKVG